MYWILVYLLVIFLILFIHYKVRKFGEHHKRLYEEGKDVDK